MAVSSTKPRGIRVRTTITSEAEFLVAFQDLCAEGIIFAPTEKMKPVGADCAFSIELADGTAMVRGLGVIKDAWPTVNNPFARPGIKIAINQLTNTTEPIFHRLVAARVAAAARPRHRTAPSTHQIWGLTPSAPPTEEMEAVEEQEASELPRSITREIRGVVPPDDLAASDESETREAPRYTDPKPGVRHGTRPGFAPVPAALVPPPLAATEPVVAASVRPPTAQAAAVESSFDLDSALSLSRPRPWWMNGRIAAVFAGGLALGLLVSLAFRPSSDRPVVSAAAPPAATVATAKPEPANCPPQVAVAPAALAVETPAAPVTETKARVAKATPTPAVATPTPVAVAKAAPPVTKPAVAKVAPPATKPTVVAKTTPTKPAVVAKTTTAPPPTVKATTATKPAATKVATKPKSKKAPCSSLDCI